MSGCGCFGRLLKRRGKSLPPGGTQVGKNKNEIDKNKNSKDSFYKSLPSLNKENTSVSQPQSPRSLQIDSTTSGVNNIKKILLNEERQNKSSSTNKLEENIYDNDLIIPAPINFREKAVSKESLDDHDEDFTISSSQSDRENETIRNQEIEFLNQLNKDLNQQLKSQSHHDNDEPKSAASITSGNVTIKSMISNQMPKLEPQYATISSIVKSSQKLFDTANDYKPSAPTTSNFSTKKSNLQASVTFKEEESITSQANNTFHIDEIQKIVNGLNFDRDEVEKLKSENKSLSAKIEGLQNQLLDREAKYKKENDLLIERIHNILTKDTRNVNEIESLAKIFLPLQQQSNQTVINEQTRIIEDLKIKCTKYENELKKPNDDNEIEKLKSQINAYKEEISVLRKLVHRLNIELSKYQTTYPSKSVKSTLSKKNELTGLPNNGPIPIWLVNIKYLSPLIASYDERINKKDEKLQFYKKKLDDLANKFKLIVDENNQLHTKLDKKNSIGFSFGPDNKDSSASSNFEQIKHHALLVLEENKSLKEDNEFCKKQLLNFQKQHIAEIGDLSKRLLINEAEKSDLKNQIQLLKGDHDQLLRKYNDSIAESQRKVKLQEHLSQTGELKRKIDEINILHKHELEHTMSQIQSIESEKQELALKNIDLFTENKKLSAENQVLDKALKEGIGRKIQRRIRELEKKIEIAELKEKTAYIILEKLKVEFDKMKLDKEAFENLTKNQELEIKKAQNKLAEENLKYSKLENRLDELKEKSASKLSIVLQKIKDKDSEFNLVKLEADKRISDILNLLQKKQDQIDELIKEKRELESEVETVWQTTTMENRRIKEAFLDMKYSKFDIHLSNSSHLKLLLDEE